MSENYQTFEFHNTFTKNIYQTNSTCQKSFLSYHSQSVFISHVSCTGTVRETWEASSMNASIIFQGVTAKLCVELFHPSWLLLMSCPICTVTAKIRSMSYIVTSGRGKMRIVLSLANPSTVSNTGLFVPPLDGCNACVI